MSPRRVVWLVAVAVLPLLVALSGDFGATWDEYQQHDKARRLIEYWTGAREKLDEPRDGAHLYGAPFDVLAEVAAGTLDADPYLIGHAVTACLGWLGAVCTGLLAARLFSHRCALLAMALLVLTPAYFAHSMNNPKDLPFAVLATAMLLTMTYISPQPPFIDRRTGIALAIVVGVGLNVRAGMLIFIGYVGVLVGYYMMASRAASWRVLASAALRLGAIAAAGLALGWWAWPWAYDQPLTAPVRATMELSRFPWGGYVLFAGRDIPSAALPASYVPTWLWLTMPPVVTMGAAIGLVAGRTRPAAVLGLVGAVVFPVIYVVGTRATLYDGVRHLLFILPPLAVLSAAGWEAALQRSGRVSRLALGFVLALGLASPLLFMVREHPNQTAYIQPLAGGPAAAFGRYDLDYWGNCMLQAMKDLDARYDRPVTVTGWPLVVLQMNASRVPSVKVVAPGADAEFSIELVRGRRDHVLALHGRSDVVGRIQTSDGATLCVTRRSPSPTPSTLFP